MIDVFFGNDAIWFSAVAFAGTAIFVLRLLLMLVGVGDLDGGDADFAAEGDSSIGLLSLNGIAGILMGFGYGALISYRSIGWEFLPSIVVGLVSGLAVGWMIAMIFHSMKKLETSGNIDSKDAVGKSAAVYTTIPDDSNARGRVRVIIDGRMRYFSARSETGSFARGSQVHISSIDDDRTVLVKSQQSDSTK